MVGALVQLLIVILIIGVLWWGFSKILPLIPIPEPFKTIAYVVLVMIVALIVIVYLLAPLLHTLTAVSHL